MGQRQGQTHIACVAGAKVTSIFIIIETVQHELLLFAAFWLIIGGIDDLVVDMIWLGRTAWRRRRFYTQHPPMRSNDIPAAKQQGTIAIFVPAWREAAVIGPMIDRCNAAWSGGAVAYRIYVGCYPNDPDGIEAVIAASCRGLPVRLVLVGHDGPTSKADCLNHLWAAMLSDETDMAQKMKAVMLHDAEDWVHLDELRIVDRLIEKHAAVQLPVIPVPVPGSTWISGHYCDEFAEAHGKTLVVREAIGAAVPLAGVGCAIDRHVLERIASENGGLPFDPSSLTEDYELGLRIGQMGLRTILVRMADAEGQLAGTRACFPESLSAAVRQKARWTTGIALAGWDRLGWQGGFAEIWMRLRDRKAILAAVVLVAAYGAIILSLVLAAAQLGGGFRPSSFDNVMRIAMGMSCAMLVWRIFMRMQHVRHVYGWRAGLLSIPRGFVANGVAILAAQRACADYLRHCLGRPLVWHSTEHRHLPPS